MAEQGSISMEFRWHLALVMDARKELVEVATADCASFNHVVVESREMWGRVGVCQKAIHISIVVRIAPKANCAFGVASMNRKANMKDFTSFDIGLAEIRAK